MIVGRSPVRPTSGRLSPANCERQEPVRYGRIFAPSLRFISFAPLAVVERKKWNPCRALKTQVFVSLHIQADLVPVRSVGLHI